jgi:hypothetical protein
MPDRRSACLLLRLDLRPAEPDPQQLDAGAGADCSESETVDDQDANDRSIGR